MDTDLKERIENLEKIISHLVSSGLMELLSLNEDFCREACHVYGDEEKLPPRSYMKACVICGEQSFRCDDESD